MMSIGRILVYGMVFLIAALLVHFGLVNVENNPPWCVRIICAAALMAILNVIWIIADAR